MSSAEDSRTDAGARAPAEASAADLVSSLARPRRRRRFSAINLLLANACIMVVLAIVLFALTYWPRAAPRAPRAADAALAPRPGDDRPGRVRREMALSWRAAERAYQAGEYPQAGERYQHLLAAAESTPDNQLLCDFFRFRISRCLSRSGQLGEARALLAAITSSPSPVIRASACYDLAMLEHLGRSHLPARRRAYQAIAALGALEAPSALETACDYVVARALTEKVLGFHEMPLSVPLSRRWEQTDVFWGLAEDPLRRLLAEGRELTEQTLLGPQVRRSQGGQQAHEFFAACQQAPLEELLHRLAVRTGMEIQWDAVEPPVRRRSVTLCLRSALPERICEVACGSAGLVARFTGEKAVICDPGSRPSLAGQGELLHAEALSTWRRFFLTLRRSANAEEIPDGHFAVAALHECRDETLMAMKEYRLVAARFPRHPAAGPALLRGAALRMRLRDYPGARADLVELLNLYPNCRDLDQVYLNLGEANRQSGLHREAIEVFRRLYHLDLSFASRSKACLGAARCHAARAEHEKACLWARRYFQLVRGVQGEEVAEVYAVMARSLDALGKGEEAARVLHSALNVRPTNRQRAIILLHLAMVLKGQRRFVEAAGALDKIDPQMLSRRQYGDYLLARSRLHRAMGLSDKARVMLRREIPGFAEESMRTQLGLEMARCHIDDEDWSGAQGVLAELLPKLHGPEAAEAACDLAEVCLAADKPAQAITVATGVLKAAPPGVRRRALLVLGRAYACQGDYDRAALAFSGMLGPPVGASPP